MLKIGKTNTPKTRFIQQPKIGAGDRIERVQSVYVSRPVFNACGVETAILKASRKGRVFYELSKNRRQIGPWEIFPLDMKSAFIRAIEYAESGDCGGFASELLNLASHAEWWTKRRLLLAVA